LGKVLFSFLHPNAISTVPASAAVVSHRALSLVLQAGSHSLMQSIPKASPPMKFIKLPSVLFKLNQDYLYSARIIFIVVVHRRLPRGAISGTKVVKTRTRRYREEEEEEEEKR